MAEDVLGVLLLPTKLEAFALEDHARELLAIPRVVALEPSRVRAPRFLREAASIRQARRLRFPGRPRVLVLYHPEQYQLARALGIQHQGSELWYVLPRPEAIEASEEARGREWQALDELARAEASGLLTDTGSGQLDDEPLRARLRDLDVINHRPFVPGGRSRR